MSLKQKNSDGCDANFAHFCLALRCAAGFHVITASHLNYKQQRALNGKIIAGSVETTQKHKLTEKNKEGKRGEAGKAQQ